MTVMKQSEFAELCGVSRAAVTNWRNGGELVMQGALVNVEATHEKMLRHRKGGSPLTGIRVGGIVLRGGPSEERAMRAGESPDQAAERIIAALGPDMDFDEARRVKENYLALQAQLEYDREAGLVVLVADVAKAVGEEYAKTRTKLLSIPSGLAPQLLRIKTAAEMCAALERAITEALEELTLDAAHA
jgi:transcriptional regulator with XRE-family HTH domain